MKFTMTAPCESCPFLTSMKRGFPLKRLKQFASGEFPCHQSAEERDGVFEAKTTSVHCAGALIFNEKRDQPHQMMRIAERLGKYDRTKLDMTAPVR